MIPSIDLMRGRCVQLIGGRPESGKTYGDPVEVALRWEAKGARYLHVIDLDAAMGRGDNLKRIVEILSVVSIGVEVGGGVRSYERADEILGAGADRVIIGTAAVKNPELVRELVKKAGGNRVMVALDSRSGKVTIEGWQRESNRTPLELGLEFERMGVGSFLFTNVDVEGTMEGVVLESVRELVRNLRTPVYASGGIGGLDDILALKRVGVQGAIVGMALYEGRFTLKQAMEVAEA
ncbi:MAG: 1-(5-phosphoribosyl)-5-[(5-phosphoribosylamino)methylideneamino]imidazole-4-carboxamide isomerase [Candidatus Hadarchaeales archaeon]